MARAFNKKTSIYFQLFRLMIIAAVAAVIVFFLLDYKVSDMIENNYYRSDFEDIRNKEYIEELQQYIDRHQLISRDSAELSDWVKQQKIVALRIYKDNIQIFNSKYPEKKLWEHEIVAGNYGWESYYTIRFRDGKADAVISGLYAYQFYSYALVAELVISFSVFLLVVFWGIRKKIRYIMVLHDEIEILEGGSLDYPITVKGKDELSELAEGLDCMRVSFQGMIEREANIVQENQKMITEMSHDIRTPVTSIMLYTEILKNGKYKDEEQLNEYIERIDRKAHRMKQLTDNFFEYMLVTGDDEIELEEPEFCEALFYDLFSETISYLEQRGFDIDFRVEWSDKKLRICSDYIIRIMDNIASNIIKYADPKKPVIISSVYVGGMVGFAFENSNKPDDEKVDSTCVGIQSIKSMMLKMGDICKVTDNGGSFCIVIAFKGYKY